MRVQHSAISHAHRQAFEVVSCLPYRSSYGTYTRMANCILTDPFCRFRDHHPGGRLNQSVVGLCRPSTWRQLRCLPIPPGAWWSPLPGRCVWANSVSRREITLLFSHQKWDFRSLGSNRDDHARRGERPKTGYGRRWAVSLRLDAAARPERIIYLRLRLPLRRRRRVRAQGRRTPPRVVWAEKQKSSGVASAGARAECLWRISRISTKQTESDANRESIAYWPAICIRY